MSVHEIYTKRISVTVLPRNRRKTDRVRCAVQERPANLAWFSIAEIQQVLNRIIHDDLTDTHLFTFTHGRYIVRVYDPKTHDSPDEPIETISETSE